MIAPSRIRARLRLPFLVLFAMLAGASSAWACTCRGPGSVELVSAASIIFRGTLLSETFEPRRCNDRAREECGVVLVGIFAVEEPLKGELGNLVRIHLYNSFNSCGPNFSLGVTAGVAATGSPEFGYAPMFCSYVPMPQQDKARLLEEALAEAFNGVPPPPRPSRPDPFAEALTRYHEQLVELNGAVESHPDDPAALFALAKFLAENGGAPEALIVLDHLLEVAPLHRDGVLLKATLYARGGKDILALGLLEPYLKAHPMDRQAVELQTLSLARANLVAYLPPDWRDFTALRVNIVDFSGRRLDEVSFRDAWLRRGIFVAADLRNADFSGATVAEADFSGANLTGASLREAGLQRAVLRGAIFDFADLADTRMSEADLRGASFVGSNLARASLRGALYDDATVWPDGFDPLTAGAVKVN